MDLSGDLDFLLADAPGSVTVTCGSDQANGILREASKLYENEVGRLDVQGVERALIFNPASLPDLKKGASLTAGGQPFRVLRPVLLREDGTALALLANP